MLPLAVVLALLPRTSDAAAPWVRTLSPAREAELLAETAQALPPEQRERLAASLARGTLIASGHCESTASVDPEDASGWIGEVSSVATIEVSNLSDHVVWAVELSVSGVDERSETEGLSPVWRANVPFLPPHSQTEILIGCAQVLTAAGEATSETVNELRTAGEAAELDPQLAARLSDEPLRHRASAPGQVLAWGAREAQASLAAAALPHLDEVEVARLMLRALRDADARRDPSWDPIDDAQLLDWLASATPGAALAIVELLLDDARVSPQSILARALPSGRPELEPSLAPVATALCERAEPDTHAQLLASQLAARVPGALGPAWTHRLLEVCPLDAEQLDALVAQLLDARRAALPGRPPTSPALARLLQHAPDPVFEATLARLGATGEAPELALVLARIDLSDSPRARALEAQLSSVPARVDALEQLSFYDPTPARVARFDHLVATLTDDPAVTATATATATAIVPLLRAAAHRSEQRALPAAWLERLLALARLDPPRLRPHALTLVAQSQPVFRPAAFTELPDRDPLALAQLFARDPCFAEPSLETLASCAALLDADPELAALARHPEGLQASFVARATELLLDAAPLTAQPALIPALVSHGLPAAPIAADLCARVDVLGPRSSEAQPLLESLHRFAVDQPCVVALDDRQRRERLARALLAVAALVVLGLLALAWRRRA